MQKQDHVRNLSQFKIRLSEPNRLFLEEYIEKSHTVNNISEAIREILYQLDAGTNNGKLNAIGKDVSTILELIKSDKTASEIQEAQNNVSDRIQKQTSQRADKVASKPTNQWVE
ncbi:MULTISPECIES: hypothetical protein [Latilactobacillus]|uniref:Uncharacterized protein n=1 Tax=Latilactobacillus curvatus TaxID=28038 RepID=A0ABN6GL88_LATCU|nr:MULTISPECIES: hypothetical protein [Latilactobacillus]ASN13616.1 hypothetical protein B4V05_10315 [Latilactobacillus sakei]KGB14886.1 hypothetical protein KY41_04550 [Latilactobacillus sakei]MCW8780319.1 hypothetical protein [Latilactobacillus curvatus]UTB73263.1 hypothetical protein A4W72_10920 [Latilactobacillus curvatus]BCX31558.1 hypothetical protein LTWDN19_21250 [Latilactobacillus curvatus]